MTSKDMFSMPDENRVRDVREIVNKDIKMVLEKCQYVEDVMRSIMGSCENIKYEVDLLKGHGAFIKEYSKTPEVANFALSVRTNLHMLATRIDTHVKNAFNPVTDESLDRATHLMRVFRKDFHTLLKDIGELEAMPGNIKDEHKE